MYKFKSSGKSLKELRKKFGTGSKGFWGQEWYLNEPFYTEKPEVKEYEIELHPEWNNLTYQEQKDKIFKIIK